MRQVPDPRCGREKKHDLAEMLVCLIAGYVTGHTSIRRCLAWCERHLKWLRKGMELKNGIASASTISRMLGNIDEELFLYAFMEWIGEIIPTKGAHLAIDGKALRASASKVKSEQTPMLLNMIHTAFGLVVSQIALHDKECEITKIPELLRLIDIRGSIITTDAIGTQTEIMQQIIDQGGHFLMMVKRNQPASYEEIIMQFEMIISEEKNTGNGMAGRSPEWEKDYGKCITYEKNRDRDEYRDCRVMNDPSCISRTRKEWPFIKSVGYMRQTRILRVRDQKGEDITPSKKEFLEKGSVRQPRPVSGSDEKDDTQIIGLVSDMNMKADEMAKCRRNHWSVENRLHHVLDDTFREDRSPAKGSKNNLALIRKFAYNILRIAMIQLSITRPMPEVMDRFSDELPLLKKYIFKGIQSFY